MTIATKIRLHPPAGEHERSLAFVKRLVEEHIHKLRLALVERVGSDYDLSWSIDEEPS